MLFAAAGSIHLYSEMIGVKSVTSPSLSVPVPSTYLALIEPSYCLEYAAITEYIGFKILLNVVIKTPIY